MSLSPSTERFLSWWASELRNSVPIRWRKAWRGWRPLLILQVVETSLEVFWQKGEIRESLGRFDLDATPDAPTRTMIATAIGARRRGADRLFLLEPERAVQTEVSVPLAAQGNIRQLLGFEMDRFTPFRGSEVAFGYRVDHVDRATKQIKVHLAAVPKPSLDALLAKLASLDLRPHRLQVAGPTGASGHVEINLDSDTRVSRSWSRWLIPALSAMAGILAIMALALPFLQQRNQMAELELQLTTARTNAKMVEILQQKISARRTEGDALLHRRNEARLAVAVVNELAHILDDGSWIDELRLSDGQLSLRGFSISAASLIPALDASDYLADVRFTAPVTPEITLGREGFSISATVTSASGGE
ncbi:MAG: PilN domain-containing protein [Bradyrhizobium sp.]